MYLLDTDHISLIARGGRECTAILKRLAEIAPGQVSVSIVNYEEQMRGWFAEIAACRSVDRQPEIYARLTKMLQFYCAVQIFTFDDLAVTQFQQLWIARLRVGTMDLKIASIALVNNATLLTRNSTDFGKVPGLKTEDWSLA
jgi:tRNA(fMet)-specific endonuclease VapC